MEYITSLQEALEQSSYNDEGKGKIIQYAENLLRNNLPIIFDKAHLAKLMGIELSTLTYYAVNTDSFYKKYKIPKKAGGFRRIHSPSYNLKLIQRWILNNILYRYEIHSAATGFVPDRNILDNALPHVNQRLVYNLDIKDFFASIKISRVFYLFYNKGYTKELSYFFAKLLTYKEMLPQGSPASPCIANIICTKMDFSLSKLSERIKANYTRYADDLTFSGDFNVNTVSKTIKKIISNNGFEIQEKKERVQLHYNMQEVTGLIVNDGVKVKRKLKKELDKHIYFSNKYGVFNHLQKIGMEDKSFFKEYLFGLAAYIKMIEEEKGKEYFEKLNNLNWL